MHSPLGQSYHDDPSSSNGSSIISADSTTNPLSDVEEYLNSTRDAFNASSQYAAALQASHELSPPVFGESDRAGLYPFYSIPLDQANDSSSFIAPDQSHALSPLIAANSQLHAPIYVSADENSYARDVQLPRYSRKRSNKAKARPKHNQLPEGQPRSKRQIKRAQIIEKHGSVSATDHPKGRTRQRSDRLLEWYDSDEDTWRLAAPLDYYRGQIIEEDNGVDTYDIVPASGLHVDDITTFPPSDDLGMRYWNIEDRKSWGNILDEDNNEVMYLLEPPNTTIDTPEVDFMMHHGIIMLDPDDHPILDWPGIPRLLSTAVEGGRIEAMRRVCPWLSLPHFRARMMRTIYTPSGGTRALFGISALSQRLARFREVMECPAWRAHGRGTNTKAHTVARLAQNGINSGTTEALAPISRSDAEKRKMAQKGKFPENAGTFTLSELERRQLESRYGKRADNLANTKKRQRVGLEDAKTDIEQPAPKRAHVLGYVGT